MPALIQNEEGLAVGTIRVKPSGVAWAPTDGKRRRSLSLDKLVAFMETNGRLTVK